MTTLLWPNLQSHHIPLHHGYCNQIYDLRAVTGYASSYASSSHSMSAAGIVTLPEQSYFDFVNHTTHAIKQDASDTVDGSQNSSGQGVRDRWEHTLISIPEPGSCSGRTDGQRLCSMPTLSLCQSEGRATESAMRYDPPVRNRWYLCSHISHYGGRPECSTAQSLDSYALPTSKESAEHNPFGRSSSNKQTNCMNIRFVSCSYATRS